MKNTCSNRIVEVQKRWRILHENNTKRRIQLCVKIWKKDVIPTYSIISSPDPKGHVRYCHHLASVIRPLTFHILIYSSETTGPNGTKLGRKHLYKVLYKVSSFRPIPPTNMAAKGNSCFWLANVKKIFSSETAWPNGAKLGRKHLCKILYKTSSFNSIRPTNMAAVTKNRT